jgi:hypothetical protein
LIVIAKVSDLAGLPYWPRLLSRDQAARYVGVSPGQFDREVADGHWPPPERRGAVLSARAGRLLWDRLLLDKRQDERSGLQQDSIADNRTGGASEWAGWN